MVFFFVARGGALQNLKEGQEPRTLTPEEVVVYMGEDKHENEHLIEHGWPVDLWFHVDKLSSAHVYLRLPEGVGFDQIPEDTLEDMCQLVKNNSIEGCKLASVMVVYTPWSNLHKDHTSMDVGSVGFKSSKLRKLRRVNRDRAHVKRLEKTRREVKNPDFRGEKLAYERKLLQARKAKARAEREAAAAAEEAKAAPSARDMFYSQLASGMIPDINPGVVITRAEDEEDADHGLDAIGGGARGGPRQGDALSGVDAGLASILGTAPSATASSKQAAAGAGSGGSTKSRAEAATAGGGAGSAPQTPLDDPPAWELEAVDRNADPSADARWLRERGYGARAASEALAAAAAASGPAGCGLPPRIVALTRLYRRLGAVDGGEDAAEMGAPGVSDADADTLASAAEERGYEREALEAIFPPEEITFLGTAATGVDVAVRVPRYTAPRVVCVAGRQQPPPLTMEVYIEGGVAPAYPVEHAPVVAVHGGGLPEDALRRVTTAAGEAVRGMLGGPVIYELASVVGDQATEAGEALEAEAKRRDRARLLGQTKKKTPRGTPGLGEGRGGTAKKKVDPAVLEEKRALERARRAKDAKDRLEGVTAKAHLSMSGAAGGGAGGGGVLSRAALGGVSEDLFGMEGDGDDAVFDEDCGGASKKKGGSKKPRGGRAREDDLFSAFA